MNVLLIGATGTVGRAVRNVLLTETTNQLTLFSRHASQLSIDTTREHAISGNVNSDTDLKNALKGQDVVFAALSGNLKSMAKSIVQAMDEEHVSRLLFITSMGIYNEIPSSVGAGGNLKSNLILQSYRDAADVIESSDLNYTIIRPGWFDHGDPAYEITHKGEPFGGHDVAVEAIADLVKRLVEDSTLGSRDSLGINRPE
ncbi:MAG: NAD(P)H-binding protein [Enterococcus sp.]